jgi:spore germination protein KB
MRTEIISEKEGIALSTLFIMGPAIILPTGADALKDFWIAIILSVVLGALVSLMYIKILSAFPGKDLFDISEILFGRFAGKAVSLLYVWFAFHLASLIFADYTYFIKTVNFPEVNELTIIIFPAILCIWALKIGIEGLGRFSTLIFVPLCSFVLIAIFLLIPKMDFEHLLPVFENGFQPIFRGTFSVLTFPFAETVVFMGVFNCFRENKSISKVYLFSIILGGFFILLTKSSEVLVLGIDKFTQFYFPAYASVSRVEIGNFIQRIEIIVGLLFTLSGLVKVCICMLAACKGISKILGFDDYRFLVTPMVLLNVAFVFISYSNIIQLRFWTSYISMYYKFPFQVILPLIILAFALLKKKSNSLKQTAK